MSRGRGLRLRACAAIASALAVLCACAHASSAAAATTDLQTVCAQPSGYLVHLRLGASCFRGEETVRVSPGPTTFCLLPFFGIVARVGAPGACASAAVTVTVPGPSDTFFCANVLGVLRHVGAAQCLRGESLYVVRRGNRPPTDITLPSATLPENQPAGTVVGTLSAVDPDSGDSFSYSLVDGPGFTITGNILSTATSFDYEAHNGYAVRVRVSDGNGGTFEKSFPISVTNVNEAPSLSAPPVVDALRGCAVSRLGHG